MFLFDNKNAFNFSFSEAVSPFYSPFTATLVCVCSLNISLKDEKGENWSLRNSISLSVEIPHQWNQYRVELSMYWHYYLYQYFGIIIHMWLYVLLKERYCCCCYITAGYEGLSWDQACLCWGSSLQHIIGCVQTFSHCCPSNQLTHSPITPRQLNPPNDYKIRNQSLFLHFVEIRKFPPFPREVLYVPFC